MVRLIQLGIVALSVVAWASAGHAGWDAEADKNARSAIDAFKTGNPKTQPYFRKAYGYAVFPSVGKGGFGIGAAHGSGTVYERGRAVGTGTLTAVSIGFQLGGQTYRQIIFFKDKAAMDSFKKGDYELAAGASAIADREGASTNVDYSGGVAVFTLGERGLMFDASIGGQKFDYQANAGGAPRAYKMKKSMKGKKAMKAKKMSK